MYGKLVSVNAAYIDVDGYEGFHVKSTKHSWWITIDMQRSCCEVFGYIASNDNFEDFFGLEISEVSVTDDIGNGEFRTKALGADQGYYGNDDNAIFVTFKFSTGEVLQFAVYNSHNGYYGHNIKVLRDHETLEDTTI